MKKIALLVFIANSLLLLCSSSLFSQRPPGGGGGERKMPAFSERPPIGTITGIITDSLSNQPLEFTSVALILVENDSLVGGDLSDAKGNFLIEKVRPAKYKLKIDYVGYETKIVENVRFSPRQGSMTVDLGNIFVHSGNLNLQEVEVTAERNFLQSSLDRKSYTVEKLASAAGSSATELLSNIPSVSVDVDNNISLRGSGNVTVLIDGKPSGLTGASRSAILENIPANTIETIEVITNPSAKFDPDGTAGIINIVLKKNALQGLNGTVTAGVGTNNKYNASLNLGYRTKKFNAFANYGFNDRERWGKGINNRSSIKNGQDFEIDQTIDSERHSVSHLIKTGADFYINKNNTVGVSATFNIADDSDVEDNLTTEKLDAILAQEYNRHSDRVEDESNLDLTAFYQKKFKKEKQELMLNVSNSNFRNDDFLNIDQLFTRPDFANTILENATENSKVKQSTLQADYTHPISETIGIETGYKSTFRNIQKDFYADFFDYAQGKFVANDGLNNEFEYDEQIHALYGLYTQSINNFSFKMGARLEQALTNFDLINSEEKPFENNYFNIFPSVFLTQKLENRQKLQLSYTRRINRPRTRQLNPFVSIENNLTQRKGNPALQPEYIDAVELGYEKGMGAFNFTSAVYYRYITDLMNRNITLIDDSVSQVTFVNFESGQQYGLEFALSGEAFGRWRSNLSFNINRTVLNGENLDADLNAAGTVWNAKYIGNVSLWKGADFQLLFFYFSNRIIPQGEIRPFLWTDLGFKQKIWKNKATIGISATDIFQTRKFVIDIARVQFNLTQHVERQRESRILTVNFTYRFGEQDFSQRRRNRGGRGGGGGMDIGF